MESPYEVLGIPPDADEGEVVDAYRRRVKEAHPDRGGSAEEFQAVKDAYERIQSGEVPEAGASTDQTGPATGRRGGQPTTGAGPGHRRTGRGPSSRSGSSGRSRQSGGSTSGDDPERHRVEYLNYEVLDDYGWSLDDEDLFEKASAADLDHEDYGRLIVEDGESLLEAAENRGFAWPFACRGGACTNCAVAVLDGDIPPSVDHVLPPHLVEKGIRLSCIGAPTTDDSQVVYNVKHMPDVEELLLPASRFRQKHATD